MALVNGFPGHTAKASFADVRRGLEGAVARDNSGVMRAGVFPGAAAQLVTGRADMKLDIADFRAVLNRSGAIFLANVGVDSSVTLDAAPAANKRIDLVYVYQQSTTLGDADDVPVFGVVKGTASATPTVPALPSGVAAALPLATVEIPAGATTTSSAGVVITQVFPWTAMAGGTVHVRSAAELALWNPPNGAESFCAADGFTYLRKGGVWTGGKVALSPASGASADTTYGAYAMREGNIVHLGGRIARASIGLLTTLPVGFRPASWEFFALEQGVSTGICRTIVKETGAVEVTALGTTSGGIGLAGISFVAA